MQLAQYINAIEFDSFETYKYNHFYDVFVVTNNSDTRFYSRKDFEEVPNSIFYPDYLLNPSSKIIQKSTFDTLETFKSIIRATYQGQIVKAMSLTYTDALVLKKGEQVVGGFDISFVNSSLRTFEHDILEVAEDMWAVFNRFMHTSFSHEIIRYSVIANPNNQEWRRYRAPDSFYFNKEDRNYEASFTFPVFGREPGLTP